MIDYRIFGVHARDDMITAELKKVNAVVVYDDRPNGGCSMYTARKAFMLPTKRKHVCVLPDDMELCNDFERITNIMAKTHPDKVIYLMPMWVTKKPEADTPYLHTPWLSGGGIIIPTAYIKPCFEWIDSKFPPDTPEDYAIQEWCNKFGVDYITSIPSTVQHIGDVSLLSKNQPIRRTPFFEQDPTADWANTNIAEMV